MAGFMKKTIIPIAVFLVLVWLGQYFYIVDGKFDWFRAMLVFGVPFGIPYMFWMIPLKGSVSGMVLVLVLDVIIGALFGIFIAGWILLRALINIPVTVVRERMGKKI